MKPSWFRTLLSRPARVRDAQRRQKRKYIPILERFEDRLAPARLSIPTNLTATPGTIVTVPINIDNLDPDPATGGVGGLTGADFVLFYDANVFSVANADVKVGSLIASTQFATNPNSTTAGQLFIGLSDSSGLGFTGFAGGTLVTVDFHVKSNPTPGASLIDLAATNQGNAPLTNIADQNFAPYVLSPPPQDGFDANDGSVFIDVGSHFTLSAPGGVTAGVPFNLTVTAVDGSNNPLVNYTGIVHFSSTDAQAVLPSDTTLVNGTGTFSVTLKTAGNHTLTATDSVTATINGVASVTVNAGAATHFTVSAPAQVAIGAAFNSTVIAFDQFENTANGYHGTVHFSSSDIQATLAPNTELTTGVAVFSTTLKTVGSQTITVNDVVTGSISGSTSIAVKAAAFGEFLDPHPAAGNQFGHSVVALSTGNVVITSPFDDAGATDAGAVYLFNGATGALISTLIGSHANDNVGLGGISTLTNGNYVITTQSWDNGSIANVGAVTWGNGIAGVNGVVGPANSLVGSTANDHVGRPFSGVGNGITVLANGNYVVQSPNWDNGAFVDAGAVTFGLGTVGISGVISASNSLVGSATGDDLANGGVTALSSGNYVVRTTHWRNGAIISAGAVTFGNGVTGITGPVTAANSLVGASESDSVGLGQVVPLQNGNYVVVSPDWNNGALADVGAVTFASGVTGATGIVGPSNSLIGSTSGDQVGNGGVIPLSNGNFVVGSYNWDNGSVVNVGAATFGDGTLGIVGLVSAANSLVGVNANDNVGSGLVALTNGNYVVNSGNWDNGSISNVGAATFGNGITGITGLVSTTNSLFGNATNDSTGSSITPLSNGNYVVSNPKWTNPGTTHAGAATFGDGTTGISGPISFANSLVGLTAEDQVGSGGVFALTNGNYVVASPSWDNAGVVDAGAVTFVNGTTGISGHVTAAISLVGTTESDFAGSNGVFPLTNGNYVVVSRQWDNGAISNVGAVSFGNGNTGIIGAISPANSLVGSSADDNVGASVTLAPVIALANGNYVVRSFDWDNGAVVNAGAVTFGDGTTGTAGVVNSTNSLVGSNIGDLTDCEIIVLENGNYLVRSPSWDNRFVPNAGSLTFGNGIGGTSGAITTGNSIIGAAPQTDLETAEFDNASSTFFGSFLADGGGRVRVGSQSDGVAPSINGLICAYRFGNGVQDEGEPGIAGVQVELFGSTNSVVGDGDDVSLSVQFSNATGFYRFENPTGFVNYYLVFSPPAGYVFTPKDSGSDDSIDSDADPANGRTTLITVGSGNSPTLDAGLTGAVPTFGWAASAGSAGVDLGRGVSVDAAGNVYATGIFAGTVDFDPSPTILTLTSISATDIFVAKFSAAGLLVWARQIGGATTQESNDIVVDSTGNVFITGFFKGTCDFDPSSGIFSLTSEVSNGSSTEDIFICKLDTDGNFGWANRLAGDGDDRGTGIALDASGNVHATGFHGPGTTGSNVFVSKIDSNGTFVWTKFLGGNSNASITVDSSGNVLTTGRFTNGDFDPGSGIFRLTGAATFVSKLDSAGNFVWAKRLGAELSNDIAVDSAGSVYTTGRFRFSADFDPSSNFFNLTTSGDYDAYLSKLDSSGNFVWAKALGSSLSNELGTGLAVDGADNIYTAGTFQSSISDFDPGNGVFRLVRTGNINGFISKLNSAGTFVWAKAIGAASSFLIPKVAVDGTANVYTTGAFDDVGDFDPSTGSFNLRSSGFFADFFVSKLLPTVAPSGIDLVGQTADENLPTNTTVGMFSSTDPDPGDAQTYTLVAGPGSDDNASFAIDGNALKNAVILSYETKSNYNIRVRSTDFFGEFFEQTFVISVTDVPEAPTDIGLSPSSVAENQPTNTVVGTLSSTDDDPGNTFTYTLVSGTGSDDNGSFNISGANLRTSAAFNFENKSSYSIRVRSTDQGGLFFEETLTISVTDVNETPTNLTLTPGSIGENQPTGTAVGTLATTDPDAGNTFTYTLVTGTGSTDNASFTVSGDTLHTAAVFNFEVKSTYSIRVRTTDQNGLFFNRIFTITVTDANDAPTNIGLNGTIVTENAPIGTAIGTFSTTDIEPSNAFDYTLVSGAGSTDNAYFSIIGNTLQIATPPDFETKSVLSIRVRSTDEGNLFFEKTFTITVVDVDETIRRFTITGPTSVTAGVATTYTVTALDQFDNPATGYSGTIHFTSTDSAAALPSDTTLASSTGTFSVTLQTSGNRTITVSDTTTPSINGTTGTISVAHAAASHFGVTASSSVLAGNGLIVIVVALDDFNNTATNYSGEVQFTSSDSHAGLPGAGPLNSGQGFFAATLQTSGTQTLTVSDTVTPSISGVANINVLARPATHFVLSAPASTTAGTTISVTVSARDQFENIATSYAGTVHFASSDAAADLPTDTTLSGGAGTFSFTLKTAASTSVSVIDTVNSGLFGSASVQVTPAAVTHFDVNTSSSTTAGANLIVSITALDSFQNIVTDYSGTVGFSSSDPQANLPDSTALIAGTGLFAVTFKTAGIQTITLADTVTASINGSSTNIAVAAAALHHFGFAAVPATILTGNPFNFGVAAQDQFNNVIATYTGTVHFFSSDASAALPANTTLTSGIGTFSATLKTPGQQTLTASDLTTPSITGTSSVVSAHGLEVNSITPTATGFSTAFNKPFDATPINLYDLFGFFGVTDVALARSAVQTITFSPSMANNTTFTLYFNGATTAPITYTNTSAAALTANIQNALDALSTIGVGNTLVGAVSSNSVSVSFQNTLGFNAVSLLRSLSPGGVPNPVQIANTIQGSANLRGTLLLNSDYTSLIFQLTGTGATSVLSRGTYQITLRSAADGFQDLLGNSLDGNSDLAAGGDYVTTFTVAAAPSVILSIPDFARGPDDIYNVRIPNNAGEEVQTISFSGTAPGSTFSLAFNGVTTSAITYSTVTATLQNNIQQALLSASMTSITNSRDVGALVTAANSTSVTVRFRNVMGGFNQPQLTTVTPSVTIATTTEGVNTGIPVTLSGAAGVTDLEFDLVYNPDLLTIAGAYNLATSAGPVGSSLTLVGTPASGVAHFHFNIGTAAPLSANATLGHIVAQVPPSAADKYKAKQLLQLTNIVATGAASAPVGNTAVQVVAYFGDASGSGSIDTLDGVLISRVNALLDGGGANSLRVSGLGAYRMLDPFIIIDVNNTGFVDSGDVSLINTFFVGLYRSQIPLPPPFSTLSLAPVGPDPTLSLPSDLRATPGETIVVPINIDTTRPEGSPGMMGATLALRYDASVFTVSTADIQLGSFVAGLSGAESSGWQLRSAVNTDTGEIGISIYSIQPMVTGTGGSLVTVTLHVRQGVSATTSAINLVTAVNPSERQEYVTSVSDGISQYILHPVITDGFDAGVDGRVTVPAPILSTNVPAVPQLMQSGATAAKMPFVLEAFESVQFSALSKTELPKAMLEELFADFEAAVLYLATSEQNKSAAQDSDKNHPYSEAIDLAIMRSTECMAWQDWMSNELLFSSVNSLRRGKRLLAQAVEDGSEEAAGVEEFLTRKE